MPLHHVIRYAPTVLMLIILSPLIIPLTIIGYLIERMESKTQKDRRDETRNA